jgi:hypothetical protein
VADDYRAPESGPSDPRPPASRVYDRREGLQADWQKVFAEAAQFDNEVEIDGYAERQDLRLSLLKIAKERRSTDFVGNGPRHPEQLAFMELRLAAFWREFRQNESSIS